MLFLEFQADVTGTLTEQEVLKTLAEQQDTVLDAFSAFVARPGV